MHLQMLLSKSVTNHFCVLLCGLSHTCFCLCVCAYAMCE